MEQPTQIKDVPVSVFLAVSIVVVFSLYATTAIKTIPCGKDVMSLFYSNFVHVDIYHLLSNLFALYALSRVEVATGGKKFTALIVFLLFFNTLAEAAIYRIFKGLPCSIGFSGVLFGVAAWELVTNKGFDWMVVLSLILMRTVFFQFQRGARETRAGPPRHTPPGPPQPTQHPALEFGHVHNEPQCVRAPLHVSKVALVLVQFSVPLPNVVLEYIPRGDRGVFARLHVVLPPLRVQIVHEALHPCGN